MDLSKYPLDKLVYVVGAIVPGSVALLIYEKAVPQSFEWFVRLGFLGYKMKLTLALVVALLIGITLTTAVAFVLGAIGGVLGTRGFKPPHAHEVAPWRDPTWRTALSRVLREPPKDTKIWAAWFYEQQVQPIEFLPEGHRPLARANLEVERLANQSEDAAWALWYQHYHTLVLAPRDEDFLFHLQKGLRFNMQVASVYVLAALTFVPAIRVWWCVLPSCFWAVTLFVEEWAGTAKIMDWWSTFDRQITYLAELSRPASQANLRE